MSSRLLMFFLSILCGLFVGNTTAGAQHFYNLTAEEVGIDSVLPRFACSIPLPEGYADSTYSVGINYPEFIDMTDYGIRKLKAITTDSLGELPQVECNVVVERRRGSLEVSFVPFVFREGKYRILVSFMLSVEAKPRKEGLRRAPSTGNSDRYAQHSVLANGKWAKVRVPSSGVYLIDDALIKKAGFTNLAKVKVYGYGGALQNEQLLPEELIATDDLKEVPTCNYGGRRLFYAQGPVSWDKPSSMKRTRNPYSDYGYYFITQGEDEQSTVPLLSVKTTDGPNFITPFMR